VAQLRADSNSLRAELAAAQTEVAARDDIITALRPLSVDGVLGDTGVSILALPGSDDSTVEAARAAVVESGGRLAADVRLDQSWTSLDPPDVTDRSAAAAELREAFAGDLPVGIPPERVLALTLGWALATDPTAADPADDTTPDDTTPDDTRPDAEATEDDDPASQDTDPGAEGGVDDADSARVLQIMADYGLLTLESDEAPARTDSVIVISPGSSDLEPETVAEWREVVAAIDEAGAVVVAGAVAPEAVTTTGDLIMLIRDDDNLSGQVSTLDNLGSPVGAAALPFVMREQLAGAAGHYGFDGTASQPFPPVSSSGDG
jgi:predicted  nucleic acid-binding Zn-ribbon protein